MYSKRVLTCIMQSVVLFVAVVIFKNKEYIAIFFV